MGPDAHQAAPSGSRLESSATPLKRLTVDPRLTTLRVKASIALVRAPFRRVHDAPLSVRCPGTVAHGYLQSMQNAVNRPWPRYKHTVMTPLTPPHRAYRRIEGSERGLPPSGRRVGPADPRERLSVTIYLRRRPDAPPLPELHKAEPRGFRPPISRQHFAATYGAAPADLERVAELARRQALTVEEVHVARRSVEVSGSVEQMNRAFGVDLGRYESPQGPYRGHEGYVYVPEEVADCVEGVFGLDDRPV